MTDGSTVLHYTTVLYWCLILGTRRSFASDALYHLADTFYNPYRKLIHTLYTPYTHPIYTLNTCPILALLPQTATPLVRVGWLVGSSFDICSRQQHPKMFFLSSGCTLMRSR